MQAVCSDFSEEMENNNICDCALKARRLRGRRMRSPSLSKNKTLNYQCKTGLQTSNKLVQGCKAHVVRKQRFRPPSASICKFYEKEEIEEDEVGRMSVTFVLEVLYKYYDFTTHAKERNRRYVTFVAKSM